MITGRFAQFASLLLFLALFFPPGGQAKTVLPWERNTQSSGEARQQGEQRYVEPGEPYDPARHGTSQQSQGYGQQQETPDQNSTGSYDRGYDALRNNGRGAYGSPSAPAQGRSGSGYRAENYDRNSGDRTSRPYDRYDRQQGDSGRTYSGQQYMGRPAQPGAYPRDDGYRQGGRYNPQPGYGYQPPEAGGPGQAYAPPPAAGKYGSYQQQPPVRNRAYDDTYSDDEILRAGHKFFGQVTKGLAKVIAHVFKKSGRPNGYILGEEGGGALIAGLRYGEGTLYTKAGERRHIYWQGPSIGYDFGAEGAKTMILVYNLHNIEKMYGRFAGVDGSAYLVGGVGVTFQKRGNVVLAPIRSGLGVRLGANVGYLKYTRRPTWNPF